MAGDACSISNLPPRARAKPRYDALAGHLRCGNREGLNTRFAVSMLAENGYTDEAPNFVYSSLRHIDGAFVVAAQYVSLAFCMVLDILFFCSPALSRANSLF